MIVFDAKKFLGPGSFLGIDWPYLLAEWQSMFNRGSIVSDIWAGITVALVALPLNLALAVAAGVEPGVGITTAIIASVIASLFGGQRYAITGPAATMAVVLLQISQTHGIAAVWLVGIIAGLLQFFAGALRFGKLMSFIPMPVIVGFTNAIGILIIFNSLANFMGIPKQPIAHVGELPPLAGHPLVPEFIEDVVGLLWHVFVRHEWNIYAVIIGFLVVMVALLSPKITKAIPGQLIAIVVVSLIATIFGYDIPRIIDISQMPRSLPSPIIPNLPWQDIQTLFTSAITIFLLGSIESLLSASVADGMTMSKKHHSDQELIGQGLANMIVPLFGGIPVTGVIARTAINIRAGARTRLSGVIHAAVLMGLSMIFAKQAEQIPLSALSGILIIAGVRLLEWDSTKRIWYASKAEGMVTIITTLVSVFVDLTAGVMTGLLLTCGLFIRQISAIKVIPQQYDPNRRTNIRLPIPTCKFVRTFLVDGPLFFGAAERFVETVSYTQNLKVVILHMKSVHIMDLTGAQTVLAINDQLHRGNVRLVLAELSDQPLEILEKIGALDKIGRENIFTDFREAILSVNESLLETSCRGCAAKLKSVSERTGKGHKDCLLRRSIMLNTDKIANLLKERMKNMPSPTLTGLGIYAGIDLERLLPVRTVSDIPPHLQRTPVEDLLRSQNMYDIGYDISPAPNLIICMCIDHRKQLHLPKNGAYIIRSPGANMKGQEYSIALALGAGINYMALIVHNKCLMSNPFEQKEPLQKALQTKHGWNDQQLADAFGHFASRQIGDPISFALSERDRLQDLFKGLKVIPLLYDVYSDRLYVIKPELGEPTQSNSLVLQT